MTDRAKTFTGAACELPELVVQYADGRSERHTLSGKPQIAGRDPNCDIHIGDPSASRQHARFVPSERGYVVHDLGSKNGTLVNDRRCNATVLNDGDEVLIGAVVAQFFEHTSTSQSVVIADAPNTTHAAHFATADPELRLSQRRLQVLYDLSERLTRLQDRNVLLEDALSVCFDMLRFERGAIGLRIPGQQTLEWPVVRHLHGADGELTVSRSILRRALEDGERAVFTEGDMAAGDPTVSMVQQGIRSAMCVPMTHQDEILGIVYGDRTSTSVAYSPEDVDFLAAIARQVSIGVVNARLVVEQRNMARMERDLDLARSIQQGLFPSTLPSTPGFSVAALNEPGNRVSGDYYDVVQAADGQVWLLLADVSGEGIPAALLMANLQAAVRVTLAQERDPAVLLKRWNDLILANTDGSKFITCNLISVDPQRRCVRYASAGHHAPLLIPFDGSAASPLACREETFPLGIVSEAVYTTEERTLPQGEHLFLCYTDGVIEAMNASGDQFGSSGLMRALTAKPANDPSRCLEIVREAVKHFAAGAPQSDDITMLAAYIA